MNIEVITKDDLQEMKLEILKEMSTLIKCKAKERNWLKSADLCEMFGISLGTLQNLRVNGTVPFTKLGGTLYYSHDDVIAILNRNKRNTQ
jgi:hypothetical protein